MTIQQVCRDDRALRGGDENSVHFMEVGYPLCIGLQVHIESAERVWRWLLERKRRRKERREIKTEAENDWTHLSTLFSITPCPLTGSYPAKHDAPLRNPAVLTVSFANLVPVGVIVDVDIEGDEPLWRLKTKLRSMTEVEAARVLGVDDVACGASVMWQ